MGAAAAVPLIALSTGASAGQGFLQAREQRRTNRNNLRNAERNLAITKAQLEESTSVQAQSLSRQYKQLMGEVRVRAAQARTGSSSVTQRDIEGSLVAKEIEETQNLFASRDSEIKRQESEVDRIRESLSSINPVLGGLFGGLSGLSTGLSIASNLPDKGLVTADGGRKGI